MKSSDSLTFTQSVKAAFAEASEYKLSGPLKGRGHIRRCTIEPHYSRVARQSIRPGHYFHKWTGWSSKAYFYPVELVERACAILDIPADSIIVSVDFSKTCCLESA